MERPVEDSAGRTAAVGGPGAPPPVGSRVVAFLVAVLLGVVCAVSALFALWPQPPGREPGLDQALPEVLVVAGAGVGAGAALRWAFGLHHRGAVVAGWLVGLTPCALVVVELLRR